MTTPTEQLDVTMLLEAQHEQLKELLARLTAAPAGDTAGLFCELRRMLAVHETAEEEVVYPALRQLGRDANRIAHERIGEEGTAKEALNRLEALEPGSQEFARGIASLSEGAIAHAEAEEREVFPLLRAAASAGTLASMGKALHTAESAAPMHAHPHAPDSMAGNWVTGPFVAIADRVRDAMRHKS